MELLAASFALLAEKQPLVLVIEDLHWIDRATEEVVHSLVEDAKGLRLLLVLVFRPEYLKQWEKAKEHSLIELWGLPSTSAAEMVRAVLGRPHATWVALRKISPQQSTEMVRQLLDTTAIPAELAQLVSETSDGNPLFIEELVVSLIEGGALARRGDEWVLRAAPETLRVPDRVQNLFAARVDRLEENLKELLKVAAVIGRVFSPAILKSVLDGDWVEDALRDLEALELVYGLPDTTPAAYSFKHALCQDAVYGQIREVRKRLYHAQVARAMESLYADRIDEHCELLAHHYSVSAGLRETSDETAAGRAGIDAAEHSERADKALRYLQQANRKAISVSAMADAQKHYRLARLALTLLPFDLRNQRRTLELVLDQVFVALALFTYRDYYKLLSDHAEIAESLGDRRLLGAFHARVGWCQWALGEFEKGIETLNRAVEHCTASGNDEDLGFALMTKAWSELGLGRFQPALGSCQAALDALSRKFNLQSYVRTRAAASVVHAYLGNFALGIEEGKKAIEAAERYGDAGATSFAAMLATWSYAFQGDLEQALNVANFSIAKADTPADRLFARGSWGLVQCRLGAAGAASEALAQVMSVIRPMVFAACETFGLYYCEALLRAGELVQAKAQLLECLQVIGPSGAAFYIACADRLLGEVATAEGGDQYPVAAAHLEKSIFRDHCARRRRRTRP
jgi:tetratricopeptide (TPR) repeat protein